MKKLFLLLLYILPTCLLAQIEIEGVKIPYTHKTEEAILTLNGAGVREKYFMDMYVGALYVKEKSTDPAKLMIANEPICIKLHIISSMITSKKMTESIDDGFARSTNNDVKPILSKINLIKAAFHEDITKGDVFDIVYEPSKGSSIYKNSKLVTTILGLDFKKALFGIWLCENAAAKDLQKKLLGK